VNSQVFDHTSLIRFIEARFGGTSGLLEETNITPWRRAVAGDLTSAFDFKKPNGPRRVMLPVTIVTSRQTSCFTRTLTSFLQRIRRNRCLPGTFRQ